MTVSERLREARETTDLSRQKVAAWLDVSEKTVERDESGHRVPRARLMAYAELYATTLDWLEGKVAV